MSVSGKIAGLFVNYRVDQWLGLGWIKSQAKNTWSQSKRLFTPLQATRSESFEQALGRLNLSEDDLLQRQVEFNNFYILFLTIALGVFVYAVVLGFWGNLQGFALATAVSVLSLSQAFRYHFWLFQMRHRKLGCTFQEWWTDTVDTPEPTAMVQNQNQTHLPTGMQQPGMQAPVAQNIQQNQTTDSTMQDLENFDWRPQDKTVVDQDADFDFDFSPQTPNDNKTGS